MTELPRNHVLCYIVNLLVIDEIKKAKKLVRAVRRYARQGLEEGGWHDHSEPKDHHKRWGHHGTTILYFLCCKIFF